jgi:hypothetical protein
MLDEIIGVQVEIIDTQEPTCELCEEYKYKYLKFLEFTTESRTENTETQNQDDEVICVTCEEASINELLLIDKTQFTGISGKANYLLHIRRDDVVTELGESELMWFNVIGIEDSSLESKINRELGKAATSWIKGGINPKNVYSTFLICNSDRFLSVMMQHDNGEVRMMMEFYCVYITIDVQSGNRVFLNELIRVDEEFATLIHNGDRVHSTSHGSGLTASGSNEIPSHWTVEKVLEKLEQCSIDKADREYSDMFEFFSSSFYVEHGKLVIVLTGGTEQIHLAINTDDIEDFLLVPKW